MRIGIDGRLIGETGIGRYIRNIVAGLSRIDAVNDYVLYVPPNSAYGTPPGSRWTVRQTPVHWHTVDEQVVMPRLYREDRLDLVHIPYVTVPVLYGGRTVVTMHDLTLLTTDTGKASTLPRPLYLAKRAALGAMLRVGLRHAARVIAVSRATETELIRTYPFLSGKTDVIYEGVDDALMAVSHAAAGTVPDSPYILAVGNAYPHKNLGMLVTAFGRVAASRPEALLVMVGRRDFFYDRLERETAAAPYGDRIRFLHDVDDARLAALYAHAHAFVFPSKAEGFGLPAVEAAAIGCPLIVSDIPVFHEILGDIPAYVPAGDTGGWAREMDRALSQTPPLTPHAALTRTFTWDAAARQTLSVYETCVRV